MKDNIPAEEKLLRLIRKSKKQEPLAAPKSEAALLRPEHKVKHSSSARLKKHLSFEHAHQSARVILALSCLYLATAFIYPFFGLKRIKVPQDIQQNTALSPDAKEAVKPYEFYLQAARSRQIFSNSAIAQPQALASSVNMDLTRDITLVGVIADKNPQVIIEDKKTQKTYYLTKGQYLGQLQIEDIQQGKVILGSGGQHFELFL